MPNWSNSRRKRCWPTCDAGDIDYWRRPGRAFAGWGAAMRGDQRGLERMGAVLQEWRDIAMFESMHYMLALYAEACMRHGRPAGAEAALAEALTLVQDTGECWYEAELHRLRGEVAARRPPSGRELDQGSMLPAGPARGTTSGGASARTTGAGQPRRQISCRKGRTRHIDLHPRTHPAARRTRGAHTRSDGSQGTPAAGRPEIALIVPRNCANWPGFSRTEHSRPDEVEAAVQRRIAPAPGLRHNRRMRTSREHPCRTS